MAQTRKTPDTWITAGLKALPKTGPDGLRAETLARTLGTTKGSFYWHFKDVPTFQAAVLDTWLEHSRTRLADAVEQGDTTVTQLRSLSQWRPNPLDHAVRGWGVQDRQARKVVAKLDKDMLTRLTGLLNDLDATHPDFPGLIHAAMIASPSKGNHAETLVDLLLVLK